MSITGIEAIEFNNTLTARMDADSPGGTINLRSKYAFQRRHAGAVFQAYQRVGTSDASLKREYFPDDKKHNRIFPSGQFGYADLFFNDRLGIEFNTSYNANFVQQDRVQMRYNYNTPAAGATVATPKLNDMMFRPGPKMTHREAANLSVDYKLTPDLVFSWRSSYSFYDVEYVNQYLYLFTPVATQTPDSTLTHIVVRPANTTTGAAVTGRTTAPHLHTQYSHRYAGTPVFILAPKIEYKGDTWQSTLRRLTRNPSLISATPAKGSSCAPTIGSRASASRPTARGGLPHLDARANRGPQLERPDELEDRDDDIGNNIRTSESNATNEACGCVRPEETTAHPRATGHALRRLRHPHQRLANHRGRLQTIPVCRPHQ